VTGRCSPAAFPIFQGFVKLCCSRESAAIGGLDVCHIGEVVAERNEKGVTAIEYGLIAALIAVTAISALQKVGTSLTSTFNTIATKL
jgi:pilus assembly protein Flp/PilA